MKWNRKEAERERLLANMSNFKPTEIKKHHDRLEVALKTSGFRGANVRASFFGADRQGMASARSSRVRSSARRRHNSSVRGGMAQTSVFGGSSRKVGHSQVMNAHNSTFTGDSNNVYGQATTALSPHGQSRSITKDGGSVFDQNMVSQMED